MKTKRIRKARRVKGGDFDSTSTPQPLPPQPPQSWWGSLTNMWNQTKKASSNLFKSPQQQQPQQPQPPMFASTSPNNSMSFGGKKGRRKSHRKMKRKSTRNK